MVVECQNMVVECLLLMEDRIAIDLGILLGF